MPERIHSSKDEEIVLTPLKQNGATRVLRVERVQAGSLAHSQVHHVAGGPYAGIVISKATSEGPSSLGSDTVRIFNAFVMQPAADGSPQEVKERRLLRFWYRHGHYNREEDTERFFRTLLRKFPKEYLAFVKLVLNMVRNYPPITMLEIEFRPLSKANTTQNVSYERRHSIGDPLATEVTAQKELKEDLPEACEDFDSGSLPLGVTVRQRTQRVVVAAQRMPMLFGLGMGVVNNEPSVQSIPQSSADTAPRPDSPKKKDRHISNYSSKHFQFDERRKAEYTSATRSTEPSTSSSPASSPAALLHEQDIRHHTATSCTEDAQRTLRSPTIMAGLPKDEQVERDTRGRKRTRAIPQPSPERNTSTRSRSYDDSQLEKDSPLSTDRVLEETRFNRDRLHIKSPRRSHDWHHRKLTTVPRRERSPSYGAAPGSPRSPGTPRSPTAGYYPAIAFAGDQHLDDRNDNVDDSAFISKTQYSDAGQASSRDKPNENITRMDGHEKQGKHNMVAAKQESAQLSQQIKGMPSQEDDSPEINLQVNMQGHTSTWLAPSPAKEPPKSVVKLDGRPKSGHRLTWEDESDQLQAGNRDQSPADVGQWKYSDSSRSGIGSCPDKTRNESPKQLSQDHEVEEAAHNQDSPRNARVSYNHSRFEEETPRSPEAVSNKMRDVSPPGRHTKPVVPPKSNEAIWITKRCKLLSTLEDAFPNPRPISEITSLTGLSRIDTGNLINDLWTEGMVAEIDRNLWLRVEPKNREKADDRRYSSGRFGSRINTKPKELQMVDHMPKFSHREEPTTAIISLLYCEKVAVDAMMESCATFLQCKARDEGQVYTVGSIGRHKVVSTKIPRIGSGQDANGAAGNTVTKLLGTFTRIAHVLLVGVGGSIPCYHDDHRHVRLGDVVVSKPEYSGGPVYVHVNDIEEDSSGGISFATQSWGPTARALSKAIDAMQEKERRESFYGMSWDKHLEDGLKELEADETSYVRPPPSSDKLLRIIGSGRMEEVPNPRPARGSARDRRSNRPLVHYGAIGSGCPKLFSVDDRRQEFAIFNEVRALDAGFQAAMQAIEGNCKDSFAIVRGISDYVDGMSNKEWQPYASLAAAAYLKALLSELSPGDHL